MSQSTFSSTTAKRTVDVSSRRVLINSDTRVLDKVINNAQYVIRNTNVFRWSLSELRQLIIKAANLINKRVCLYEHPSLSTRMQSVAWHFINEFLECELDTDLHNALNQLLIAMGMTFEYAGIAAAEGVDLTALDVARDLNETMKLLDYPFSFHQNIYGNQEALRSRAGKSSLRRPIAKAELVLAWAAHMLRLTRPAEKFTKHELTFINTLGTLLNAFNNRYELIMNIKYHQPCLDQLAFIRLMEVVYVLNAKNIITEANIYASWFDAPDRFNHIEDFMDIRLSINPEDIRSNLSYIPRMSSMHPLGKTIFYNPVKCTPDSPIALATIAWMDAVRRMRGDLSFSSIMTETAVASFAYEAGFNAATVPLNEDPDWYKDVHTFDLTITDDQELYAHQTDTINAELKPIKERIIQSMNDDPLWDNKHPTIIFSVMVRSEDSSRPELSLIQL